MKKYINMSRKISRELGIGVGISSGANFLGCVKILDLLGLDSIVCTVFPDDNKKYLSTDLSKPQTIKDNFLSDKISLLDIKVL